MTIFSFFLFLLGFIAFLFFFFLLLSLLLLHLEFSQNFGHISLDIYPDIYLDIYPKKGEKRFLGGRGFSLFH